MRLKKFSILMLTSIMSIGSCTGCNKEEKTVLSEIQDVEEKEVVSDNEEPQVTGDSNEESNIPELPSIELENKKIIHFGVGAVDDETSMAKHAKRVFEEAYGGEVESIVTTYDDFYTQLATLIAAGTPPDVVTYMGHDWYPLVMTHDLAQELDGKIDFDTLLWKDMKESTESMKWLNGKTYGVTVQEKAVRVIYYNEEMFENAGLDTPGDYYERGEWTVDKMVELAEALTLKNQEGEVTQYGLTILGGTPLFIPIYEEPMIKIENGKFVNNVRSEGVTKSMNLLVDLTSKGVISENYSNFADQKTAMMLFHAGGPSSDFLELTDRGVVGVVPYPKADMDSQNNVLLETTGYFIPKGSKNPEGALAFINAARYTQTEYFKTTDEIYLQSPEANISEELSEVEEQLQKLYEECNKISNSEFKTLIGNLDTGYGQLLHEGKTWSTVVEEVYPRVEQMVNEYNSVLE